MELGKLSKLTTVPAVLLFSAITINASTLTVDNSGTSTFQQTQSSPCVIGEPSCTNPTGFGLGVIPPNTSPYDVSSPAYTVQQIRDIVGSQFIVGVDVNLGQLTHHLDIFTLAINGTVQFELGAGGSDLALFNNGNGRSDSLIQGFDLSSFASTDSAVFRAVVSNADDGREQFFLISSGGGSAVPEPSTVVLMGFGLGLIGLSSWRRRRRAEGDSNLVQGFVNTVTYSWGKL